MIHSARRYNQDIEVALLRGILGIRCLPPFSVAPGPDYSLTGNTGKLLTHHKQLCNEYVFRSYTMTDWITAAIFHRHIEFE